MWSRQELKDRAKNVLHSCYWYSVLVCFIITLITGGFKFSFNYGNTSKTASSLGLQDYYDSLKSGDIAGAQVYMEDFLSSISSTTILLIIGVIVSIIVTAIVIGTLFSLLVVNPIKIGSNRFFMVSRENKAELSELLYAFKSGKYLNIVKIEFLRGFFTWLWSLLFVIPGIVKSYEYRMIPYILSEDPEISYKDAFRLSKEMMMGEKWNTFVLDLSFIGWYILTACCTCGILGIFYVNPYVQHTYAELYAVLRERVLQAGTSSTYELSGFGAFTQE